MGKLWYHFVMISIKMDFRFWWKSILHSHFRRKYFTGEACFTRPKAYFTDLQSKSISLCIGHIPMPNRRIGAAVKIIWGLLQSGRPG